MKISLYIKALMAGLAAIFFLLLDWYEFAGFFFVIWAVFATADFILDEWERRLNRTLRSHRAEQQLDRMCSSNRGISEVTK